MTGDSLLYQGIRKPAVNDRILPHQLFRVVWIGHTDGTAAIFWFYDYWIREVVFEVIQHGNMANIIRFGDGNAYFFSQFEHVFLVLCKA